MPFALDYLVLVFVASCGVLQLAASYSRLTGIYLFKTQALNLLAGLALTATPFAWFFISEPRNLPDTAGGLDANQQAALYVVGSLLGVVFTLLASSLRHLQLRPGDTATQPGLEALRHSSFHWAIRSTLGRLWTR